MRIFIIAIICVLLGNLLGVAQQATYKAYGQGNESCAEWTEQSKRRRDTHLFTWVVGFVSGAGFASARTLRTTDSAGIAAWMDTYCTANPLDSIANAAGRLVINLERSEPDT
jgi:hypothetical protein